LIKLLLSLQRQPLRKLSGLETKPTSQQEEEALRSNLNPTNKTL
jgi:hypothetical protein